MEITTKQIILGGLLGGLLINLCDVTVTVTTVAKKWNAVLESQGIKPSPFTPPYYVTGSFIAGIVLAWTISVFTAKYGLTRETALMVSVLLWGISRIYGAGHVVMGQMPLSIFSIMSSGLLLGFIVAGQVIYWYFNK
ncbi:MAG: hypothetical protein ACKV1O_23760 [Saprospiraceae bacterium]